MSITLEKRVEKVGIILAKRNITKAPIVRVGFALDISGSMQHSYDDGHVQETVDRLLGIAGKFDDNGEMDMWSFTGSYDALVPANASEYGNYVENNILAESARTADGQRVTKWGGTEYSPVMHAIVEHYFGDAPAPVEPVVEAKAGFWSGLFSGGQKAQKTITPAPTPVAEVAGIDPRTLPALALFVTDGESGDKDKTRRILREAQKHNLYWILVGLGNGNFSFLEEMADELPNVGYVNLASLKVSDEDLYDQLISEEFCTWVKKL